MNRGILFGCDGAPFRGDANAWAYNLCERMRRDGLDVVQVNLMTESDAFFFRYSYGDDFDDPRRLGNVHRCTIAEHLGREQPALCDLIRSCAPSLLVAWGVTPALLLRAAAPDLPLVLIASRCGELERLIEDGGARDSLSFRTAVERGVRFQVPRDGRELEAARACDLLVLTSQLARFAFAHFFPSQAGKMYAHTISSADLVYEEAEQFAHLRRPFAERDVDLLFADVDWGPRVKNLDLVNRIAARLGDVDVHVIGEPDGRIRRAHIHGLPRRSELYTLLGRTKVLACPALSDVGAGVVFEASAMGCNVVASASCGYSELCAEELRPAGRRDSELVECIRRAIARPFDDHRERFGGGYSDLIETLAVV